ncbi:MAG: FAD-linked oxidase C-terminal domain-containing protein [Pseudoxanthomonas sp.]|nr:FAD-linked oxidase C-terminal domain-containing protein [Pseudoxanthomonas sp.]
MANPADLVRRLRELLPVQALRTDPADRLAYGYDNSRRQGMPCAVALPERREQVVAIVQACRDTGVPLTARGRGTGTTGAAVPADDALVLSFERMDAIVAIDPARRLAIVEPGVLNGDLQAAAAAHGFFWPPDPTSAPWSTVGGNLACNAGGPRTVKYGASRDNVLAVTAVDGRGRLFDTARPLAKQAMGYDLARLLVGSEGTLALIVEATLRLLPCPEASRALAASFRDVAAAARAVTRIMAQPATPSALEFLDGKSLALARARAGNAVPAAGALLLMEVDGPASSLDDQVEALRAAASVDGLLRFQAAADGAGRESLWAARKALSPALRAVAPKKINEDVVVPVPRLPELTAFLDVLEAESGIAIVCFGHAGNGNLHVNLMYDPADPAQAAAAPVALRRLFEQVLALGGSLSGEHGIGLDKRPFMPQALDPVALSLMAGIRQAFDPDGILNPGKLLP